MKFLLVQPKKKMLELSILECTDNSDASYKTMQNAVDGNFEICSQYFDGLPENVDAWCNEDCLFRPDLLPILTYQIKGMDGSDLMGYIKGNLLFTAFNEDGETLGLTDEQIYGIEEVLQKMPVVGLMENGEFYPTFLKQ